MTKRQQKKTDPKHPVLVNVSLALVGVVLLVLVASLVWRGFQSPIDTRRAETAPALVSDRIQVSVLNGCGVSGLAAEMTGFLRRYGFDVVESGDYSSFDVEHTVVYDRIGNLQAAQQLAAALGIPETRVIQDLQLDEYLDAAVVIGLDYAELNPFKTPNASSRP